MSNKDVQEFVKKRKIRAQQIMQEIDAASDRFDQKVKEILQHC